MSLGLSAGHKSRATHHAAREYTREYIPTWTFKGCPGWRSFSSVGASIGDPDMKVLADTPYQGWFPSSDFGWIGGSTVFFSFEALQRLGAKDQRLWLTIEPEVEIIYPLRTKLCRLFPGPPSAMIRRAKILWSRIFLDPGMPGRRKHCLQFVDVPPDDEKKTEPNAWFWGPKVVCSDAPFTAGPSKPL